MFTKAIIKKPCRNFINGITTANLGRPEYDKAMWQHEEYGKSLEKCGLKLICLEADEAFPDSVFVEDTAILTAKVAIITSPGDPTRNGEVKSMVTELVNHFEHIDRISFPGTLDGGDIMQIENEFYIGISARTNHEGAMQLKAILEKHGYRGIPVELHNVLHLKTGVNYLDNNNLLVSGEFIDKEEFRSFNKIIIPKEEAYAANSLWINGKVLVPAGFPLTKQLIEQKGYAVVEVNVSEFQKLDGGLSCLSLRF